tara:strand:+ start:529 stop:1083 length:555 start_codon:yes stop_codon:yes gene_type:complete
MVKIFEPLLDLQDNQLKSANWYKNAASLIADKVSSNKLMRSGKLLGRPSAGRMCMFFYDPKTRQKLPFYDIFPLVLPVDTFRGGFVGLNFHYLPYGLRYKLLEQLQQFATNKKFDETTRLQVTYNSVKNIGLIKPAIKKYLWRQVQSNFLRVDVDEMAIAIYLPVAQFKKASLSRVFADSRRKI